MKTIYALLMSACLSLIAYGQTPPTANFTGTPTTVCLGLAVTFTSTSTQGTAAITSYAYDFGAVHLGDPKTYGFTLVARF